MADTMINLALLIIAILGFIVTIIVLKKDNRKSNEETIENIINKTITDVKERMIIEKRVELLEQKVQFLDGETKKELGELKEMIRSWDKKLDKHLDPHGH